MRITIRAQLALMVAICVLLALAVVAIPTWIYVNQFVLNVEIDSLSLTASVKAARVSSELDLIQTTCDSIASRILIQNALIHFYQGATDDSNWYFAENDLQSALSSAGFTNVYQARIYSRNTTGSPGGLLNVTGDNIKSIVLPYAAPNGSEVRLSDSEYGYPPELYPNITYFDTAEPSSIDNTTDIYEASPFPDVELTDYEGLLLGPMMINATFALISITVPIRQNSNQGFVLGYMTLVASASGLIDVMTSREGLQHTGVVLLVGPATPWNRFANTSYLYNSTFELPGRERPSDIDVHFVLPPLKAPTGTDRHSQHDYASKNYEDSFKLNTFPAILTEYTTYIDTINNASATLSTENEQGYPVAVGYARPKSMLVDWVLAVEQDHNEAYNAVYTLRNILLACVFGTAGLFGILIFPCAHLSVRPIRDLTYATKKTITPPGYSDEDEIPSSGARSSRSRISGQDWVIRLRRMTGLYTNNDSDNARREENGDGKNGYIFKIPGRIPERRHFITDELTELTTTFNAMSDELYKQYESLDEKVAERTRELEISKKAAEAANESKTLFIANISHELKTPLNGILGMCSVCMEENDLFRIRKSLRTLYKSGDLLLHLLEDLLSFSKNQIGRQVHLEEHEFRLDDIRSQVLSIFDKQVRESNISLSVSYVGSDTLELPDGPDAIAPTPANRRSSEVQTQSAADAHLPATGPPGTGRLKDMYIWGDQQRILQVLINLVSNGIKFTPHGGKVDVRIRCLEEPIQSADESRSHSLSKANNPRLSRTRQRIGPASIRSISPKTGVNGVNGVNGHNGSISSATIAATNFGTALSINPLEKTNSLSFAHVRSRSPTPPPHGAKTYVFEFEVQDTGPGIPPQMQEKVFEPFIQGDLGLSKRYGGTGLGLSICKQLANLMNGTITLKSTVGVGSTFTVLVPLRCMKERTASMTSNSVKSRPSSMYSIDGDVRRTLSLPTDPTMAKQQPMVDRSARLIGLNQSYFMTNSNNSSNSSSNSNLPQSNQSKADQMAAIDQAIANKSDGQPRVRVLVADDNSTNIEVVSRMLKLEDIYDVTIAKDGQEAYDMVKDNMQRNQLFDVIFMDIQMPNLDGLQSTRLIRKMGYSAPIVALTAFSEESNVRECLKSGMNEFLSKPIRRRALKQVLQKFATIPEEPETPGSKSAMTGKTPSPVQTPATSDSSKEMGNGQPGTATATATETATETAMEQTEQAGHLCNGASAEVGK